MAVRFDEYLFKHLRKNDGIEMNVNGSQEPATFSYDATRSVYVSRINFVIVAERLIPSRFGDIRSLDNGCTIKAIAGESVLDFMDGETIKSHSDFGLLSGVDVKHIQGRGDDIILVRWTIAKAGEGLALDTGESLQFSVQDDLRGLVSFRAMIQGYLR